MISMRVYRVLGRFAAGFSLVLMIGAIVDNGRLPLTGDARTFFFVSAMLYVVGLVVEEGSKP